MENIKKLIESNQSVTQIVNESMNYTEKYMRLFTAGVLWFRKNSPSLQGDWNKASKFVEDTVEGDENRFNRLADSLEDLGHTYTQKGNMFVIREI